MAKMSYQDFIKQSGAVKNPFNRRINYFPNVGEDHAHFCFKNINEGKMGFALNVDSTGKLYAAPLCPPLNGLTLDFNKKPCKTIGHILTPKCPESLLKDQVEFTESPFNFLTKDAVKANLLNLKNSKDSRIFSLSFMKRTDGKLRKMTARVGVKKGLSTDVDLQKRADRAIQDKANGLFNVYDVNEKDYRSIPLDNIQSFTRSGKTYFVI